MDCCLAQIVAIMLGRFVFIPYRGYMIGFLLLGYIYIYIVIELYSYMFIYLYRYCVICLLLYCMLTVWGYYFLYIYILFLFLTSTSIFLLLWLPSLYHLAFYGAKVWRFCQIPNTRRCLIRLKLFRNAFHKCCTFGFSKKLSTELFGVLTLGTTIS